MALYKCFYCYYYYYYNCLQLSDAFNTYTPEANSAFHPFGVDKWVAKLLSDEFCLALVVPSKGKLSTCVAPCMVKTTLKHSGMDHTVLPATNTMPALPRKRSPDGASTDLGGEHLIAAHYSFIDPERMKGWVGLVGWSSADCLPT